MHVLCSKVGVITLNRLFLKSTRLRTSHIRAESKDPTEETNFKLLDNAALDFVKGLEAGLSEDEIVLIQMGVSREDELTSVQKRYKSKLTEKLKQRAKELKAKNKECLAFEAGKSAYGKGDYPLSCKLLEQAAAEHSENSILGADIRMWLALAYQAVNRLEDCITLYKRLSKYHPSKKIKKQAADLLYIMEAPRLQLGEDEKVKLPVLKGLERSPSRSSVMKGRPTLKVKKMDKKNQTLEEAFWESYRPPSIQIPNRYILLASMTLCVLLAWYTISYKR